MILPASNFSHATSFLFLLLVSIDRKLGPWIAKRRTPSVSSKYQEIGGGSPILNWTRKQGSLLTDQLNSRNPSTGPHKFYVGFRYAPPLLRETLSEIAEDGVDRVIAFSQYPQYSCSTTGSSLNELAAVMTDDKSNDELRQALRGVSWSVIDRWSLNTGLIDSFTDMIEREMKERLPKDLNATQVMLLFSAHSLPMYVVARGDTYPTEVASTVMAVMSRLAFKYPYRLVWQSKVGPLPWMSPYTDQVIRSYAKKGIKNFVVIPIAFVNEHIETLHELDIEYGKELMEELKVDNILRIPAPNIHPAFIEGLYQEVVKHLSSGEVCSPQLRVTCPHCTNPSCWTMRSWLKTLSL